MKWELKQLQKQLVRLKASKAEKGTDDTFDDSLVGPVLDDEGQPILDPVRLMALGYSV